MMLQHPSRPGPGSLWIGGRSPATHTISGPTLHPDHAVLWLDATSDEILAARIVRPEEADAAFADLLGQAIRNHGGATPERVRVASESHAALVRGVLPGAVIVVGSTPEIPRVACRVFEDTDSLDDVVASYLQGGALAPAEIARYFELMAALWRAAPWRFFGDRQVLELDVPTLDVWGACVAVLGALGQMFGVVVFESFEEFEQFYAKSDPQACPADDDSRQPGVASLALTFNRGADLPAEMRFEVARQGWVVANADAYPLILPVEPDAHVRTATERDLRLACAAVAALAALIREHAQRLRARSGDELVTCISLDFPEPLEVTLGFPHSRRRKAIPGPRRPFALGSEHEHRLADRRLDEFHASELASRHLEGWLRSAVYMIDMFHGFKLDFQDGRLEGLRASHIAEFLLDYVPREVLADEEMVWHTPEVFDTYLEWLGESGREPRPTMTRIRGLVRYLRKRFIRRALDPLAFSPGKTFFVAALRAGVDLEDFAAVAAYHEDYARRCDMALEFMAEANSRSPRTVQIVRTTG